MNNLSAQHGRFVEITTKQIVKISGTLTSIFSLMFGIYFLLCFKQHKLCVQLPNVSLHVIQPDLSIHTLNYRQKTDKNLNDNYIMMPTHANFNVSKIKCISFFRFSRKSSPHNPRQGG